MASALYLGSMAFPWPVAVVLAIVVRLLVTGALHEDGLADFFDGFGGGADRDRCMPPRIAALAVLAADPFAKLVSCSLVTMLPYARSEEEAKNKTVYRKISVPAAIGLVLQGLLPMLLLFWLTSIRWYFVVIVPCLVMCFLYFIIKRKIGSYTGDCCGAACLLVELSIYLTISSLLFTK